MGRIQLGIGSKVYEEHSRMGADPIEYTITNQTSRSWMVEFGYKRAFLIPKHSSLEVPYVHVSDSRGGYRRTLWLSLEALQDAQWAARNAYRIAEAVRMCRNRAKLEQIAAIVGVQTEQAERG